MVTLIERGLAMLAKQAPKQAGGTVVYERADQQCSIEEAAFGQTDFSIEDNGTVRVVTTDRDFIFPSEKLILSGTRATPERGDRITIVHDDRLHNEVFEVLAPGDADVYRFCDPQGILIRVHTKRIS